MRAMHVDDSTRNPTLLADTRQGTKKTYKKKSKNNEHTGEDMDRSRQTTEHKGPKTKTKKEEDFYMNFLFLARQGSTHVCPDPQLPPRRLQKGERPKANDVPPEGQALVPDGSVP